MLSRRYLFLAAIISFSSITFQLVFLREFLSTFSGNELLFGLFLGLWFLLQAIGGYIGRLIKPSSPTLLSILIAILSILLPICLFSLKLSKPLLIEQGGMVGPVAISLSLSLFLLGPCIIIGFLFVLISCIYKGTLGRVYLFDIFGYLLGGLVFTFLLVSRLSSFSILYGVSLSLLILCMFMLKRLILLPFIFILLFFSQIDYQRIALSLYYKGQEMIEVKDSPYGELVVTRLCNQLNFYQNGVLLFTTDNIAENEERAHFALIQHKDPENILLIGGGGSGIIKEIAKYRPKKIDCVEIDPLVIEAVKRRYPESGILLPSVSFHLMDGRKFVKETKTRYDAIIINLPPPFTANLNRFYTAEFFKEIEGILKKDGVISLFLPGSANYLDETRINLLSSIYWTLKDSFSNIIVVPGDTLVIVASDSPLSEKIGDMIKEKGIQTKYINESYLSGQLTSTRVNYLLSLIKRCKPNKDLEPNGYYLWILGWLGFFEKNILYLSLPILIFFLLAIFFAKPIPLSVFSLGFCGVTAEVSLCIIFQSLSGYLYYFMGALIASFSLGLILGAFLSNSRKDPSLFDMKIVVLAASAYLLLLPLLLKGVSLLGMTRLFFLILLFGIGGFVGFAFPLASLLYKKNLAERAGVLYASDMLGSFFGGISASFFLLPLLGTTNLFFLMAIFLLFVSARIRYTQ
jgi:spermidine synthase